MEKKADLRIDAVATVRRIRDAQHDQLEGKSWEERTAFYRQRASELHRSLYESGELSLHDAAR